MYLDHITDDELADVGALLENGVRLGLEVMRLVQKYRTDKTGGEELLEVMEAYRKETPFFFKGDITDLSYFWQGKALDLKSLEKLPEELKESVVRNFELLEKQGLIKVEAGKATLTEAGEKLVYSTNFVMETIKADMDYKKKIEDGITAETTRRVEEKPAQEMTWERMQDQMAAIQQKAATEPEKALTELKAMNASLEEMSPHLSPELQAKAKEVDVAVRSIVLDGKPLRETVDGLMQQWKRERPEVEINIYDNTLRTNNEIVREAVKDDIAQDAAKEAAKKGTAEAAKELGKEAAVQGAETAARGVAAAGTGGLALAVEVGYKILSSVAEELKHQITR